MNYLRRITMSNAYSFIWNRSSVNSRRTWIKENIPTLSLKYSEYSYEELTTMIKDKLERSINGLIIESEVE